MLIQTCTTTEYQKDVPNDKTHKGDNTNIIYTSYRKVLYPFSSQAVAPSIKHNNTIEHLSVYVYL